MIGQVIASAACPLTLNIMTMVIVHLRIIIVPCCVTEPYLFLFAEKFAATWFTENRRATAGVFVGKEHMPLHAWVVC